MTNYPSFAAAAATQNCQAAYVAWQLNGTDEAWNQYQIDCKIYLIVTGREFMPVLWQAVKS